MRIVGIDAAGLEATNPDMVSGRTLPWLQDVPDVDAWGKWGASWRDVRILDAKNALVDVYNLTEHDLNDAQAYAELKARLLDARN